ncbi:hypothetical protein KM043_013114 [Ampulex compressa]|nr:hypothetical protein KM043_013114 [Ampulex compressa]
MVLNFSFRRERIRCWLSSRNDCNFVVERHRCLALSSEKGIVPPVDPDDTKSRADSEPTSGQTLSSTSTSSSSTFSTIGQSCEDLQTGYYAAFCTGL